MSFDLTRVSTDKELDDALAKGSWDAILCDYMLPELSAHQALEVVRKRKLDIPFIIVSGTISDETAVDMMRAGAHDYLIKSNLSRLIPALKREILEAENRQKRRFAEANLRESELKHRLLVKSLSDTVLVITSDGVVSEFYSQFPILDTIKIEDHVGLALKDLFSKTIADRLVDLVNTTLREKEATTLEYSMNGRWHYCKLAPHEDGVRAVCVIRDVTDLKQAEEEARQSHAIAMLYQDITGHDIRNLLQAIIIAADLLGEDEKDSSRMKLIQNVVMAVQDTSELISNVQATAELLSTPLERTSLDFTLKSCVDAFSEEHQDVTINRDFNVKEAIVNADRFLCYMFMNLFSNAVRHNPKEEKLIWIQLSESGNGYELTIADNGPGIRDDMKKNLLDPDRRSGGVGILQCLQITNKYGGSFEIHDRITIEPDEGAMIRIWLPRATS